MFRTKLLQNLGAFQGRNAAVLFFRVNSFISRLVRVSSSETERNSDRLTSLLNRTRSDHTGSPTNRTLLETFEYMQRKDRERPKKEQLVSSFSIVRKIQMEADVHQLMELYEFVKNEENVAAISAQVALFSRFAALAEKGQADKATDFQLVSTSAENLLKTIKWRSRHFEHAQLASAVWHIAARGVTDKSYFIHFEKEIRSRDPSIFTNKDLAMIMWAYGKVQFRALLLYKQLRDEILARDLSSFKVEEICNIVWAYARTGERSAMLFAALKMEILRCDLKEFEESLLIIILWSYSVIGVNIKALFRKIKYEILRRGLPCFTYRQLAQIVGSYAQQNMSAPDLFQEVSSELIRRGELNNFEPVGLVTIADSFVKTKNFIQDVFKAIGEHLLNDDLSAYEPLHIVRLFWAFTDAGLLTKSLHEKLSNKILLCDFSTLKDISLEELVKALENSHFNAPKLVAATEAELVRRSEAKF